MNTLDAVHAWKDEDYRLSLNKEQRAELPAHPVGVIEITDMELVIARWERDVLFSNAASPTGLAAHIWLGKPRH